MLVGRASKRSVTGSLMNGMRENIPLPMKYPKITIGFLCLILSVTYPAKAVARSAAAAKNSVICSGIGGILYHKLDYVHHYNCLQKTQQRL